MSRLDDIQARHDAWYSGDDTTAQWPDDLGFVESYEHDKDSTPCKRAMAHEIVREDVPTLLELARKQQAALDALLFVADNRADLSKPVGRWWSEVIKGTIRQYMEAKP